MSRTNHELYIQNSVNQSSEADLRKRQERINNLQDQLKTLEARETSTIQQLEQFQHAINKSKDEHYKLGLVILLMSQMYMATCYGALLPSLFMIKWSTACYMTFVL